jgi:HlyD family secretion protein
MKRALVLAFALMLAACGDKDNADLLQGYGEADYIYLSAQDSGIVGDLLVAEGDAVEPGQVVFRLNPDRMSYQAQSVSAERSAQAEAVRAAQADAALARQNLTRGQELFERGFYPRARLDSDIAADNAARAHLAQSRRALGAAGAETSLAARRLEDLDGVAPAAGVIQHIYHRPGEVVSAGEPIVSLLAPQNMKVRFFAPQDALARLEVGGMVDISCDGCAEGLQARISFVADEPQFTPPVIYSLDERDKLVFLIEARPLDPSAIRPGIPVDVRLPAAPQS